ncbi:MAG: LysM peptidoglycan-binding domain-containing protein [Armatimonadota bacterium]
MGRHPRWLRWGLLCAAAGALTAAPALGGREGADPNGQPLVVEVRYGDSLWTIAREHGDPDRDVRDVVWLIGQANDTDPAELQPGDEIVIPAECLP